MILWVLLAILCLLLAALQGSLIAVIPWEWARPDLLLAFLVLTAMKRGPTAGTWFGFFVGIIRDLSQPTLLGLRALTMALVGFSAGRIAENVDRTSRFVQGLVLLVLGLGARFLETLLADILEGVGTWGWFLLSGIPNVFVTAIVIPLIMGLWGIVRVSRRR
jgi:rod shape-determining protein MreD